MPVDWLVLLAALGSGLLGGLHCIAMCGGIATGLSAGSATGGWPAALQLNLGRIGGYTLAGLAVGLAGHGLLAVLRGPWIGVALRLLAGLALVVVALRLLELRLLPAFLARPGSRVWSWLAPLQRRLLPADTVAKRLAAGALWGWLPCGLVYSTLLWAASQGDALDSALLMFAFGLGTWPVLLATGLAAERITALLRRRGVRIAGGLLVILFGLWTLPGPHQDWLMGHGGQHQQHAPAR